MLPRLIQSTLLEAGSSSIKFSFTGDGIWLLDRDSVASFVDFEASSLLLEDARGGIAALTPLESLFSSIIGLPLTDGACLFGGGDIELFLDDWNAS